MTVSRSVVAFAINIERYVKGHDLASADTIEYRMVSLLDRFGSQRLSEIKQGDIEEFIVDLGQPSIVSKGQKTVRVRKPATINRYISLLRHMFSWAIDHELLDQSPMRRIRRVDEQGDIRATLSGNFDSTGHGRQDCAIGRGANSVCTTPV